MAEAKIEAGLKYTKSHEWAKIDGDSATIGLADYAQHALGDLVFINLPEEGDEVSAGDVLGDVESVKAVSDIYSPVSGKVVEVNEDVIDDPASINADPYGAWFVKVEGVTEGDLLDEGAYAELVASED